ncbi:rRNA maturation RNase YbeY [Pedobacter sp. HMF7647]|uniref:Endoribonuclease YbeY n=1 Tax=Hufsiella arboris TaxID=2695275 RepID=A0A7K1Y6M8_9SPHI|nr:rRNA maturation RNase YbeY [Hufsiella arboris]MXV49779.1 rRNA maturation RNase YbeY [Hufsiella arboris]
MPKSSIQFFSEDIPFILKNKGKIRQWLDTTIRHEGKHTGMLNFIFCSDSYLLNINRQYLNHDTYTDIITFDTSEEKKEISGDIFISIERVKENAVKFGVSEFDEVCRIVIHGTLHLIGYKDKSKADKALMTQKEDQYLSARSSV